MIATIARRVAGSLGVLVLSSMVIFVIVTLSGDPLADLRDRQPPVPEEVIQAESHRLGLDRPLPARYLSWVLGLFRGYLGPSVVPSRDLAHELSSRIAVTMTLVVVAIVLAFLLSLLAGTISALHQRRWPDLLLTPMAFIMFALPSFWLAVLLKQWGIGINQLTGFQIFATIGSSSVPQPEGFFPRLADTAAHLLLPTVVLTMVHFAVWSRYQRTAVAESLAGDHVRFAVMNGLPRRRIVRSYVMRPALVPIITIVALDLPTMFSGVIITEMVFQWRGMGSFLLESITIRDTNAVLAWLLVTATAVVLFNLLADILYAVFDPRVRNAA